MSSTFAPGAARRTRSTRGTSSLSLTRDPATDRLERRHNRPTVRRQSTRRAAVLAAIREESLSSI